MNPHYNEFRFPQIRAHPWAKVFAPSVDPQAVDLVSALLRYSPQHRLTALQALAHPFFDELRKPSCRLPSGACGAAAWAGGLALQRDSCASAHSRTPHLPTHAHLRQAPPARRGLDARRAAQRVA